MLSLFTAVIVSDDVPFPPEESQLYSHINSLVT